MKARLVTPPEMEADAWETTPREPPREPGRAEPAEEPVPAWEVIVESKGVGCLVIIRVGS